MRLPRFRLRTLMIAVAVAGIVSWAVVSLPGIGYVCALLTVLLIVPVLGACWGGYRSANPFDGSTVGGIVGALIQSAVIGAYFGPRALGLSAGAWATAGMMLFLMLATSAFLGSIAGLLVGSVLHRARDRRRRTLD